MAQSWYALRTFYCQEQKVGLFLTENQLTSFIPMTYAREGHEKPVLVPAIHNLIFVRKDLPEKQLLLLMRDCPVPTSFFRHTDSGKICQISDHEMTEFRMLCDPTYDNTVFLSSDEADVMVGKNVRITKGAFKGSVGQLVRKHKQYYFLKTVIGTSVMVRISRWYCEPI